MRSILKKIFLLGIVMILWGCSTKPNFSNKEVHNETIRVVGKDNEIQIYVMENASTGYSWQYSASDNVKFISSKELKEDDEMETVLVGKGKEMIYRFEVKDGNPVMINMKYVSPGSDKKVEYDYTFNIQEDGIWTLN